MERLVVDAKNPRRFALVSMGTAKSQAYRLSLRFAGGTLRELLQREGRLTCSCGVRAYHARNVRNSRTNVEKRVSYEWITTGAIA